MRWIGSSRRDVQAFPQAVRREIGQALYAAQSGEIDPSAKPLRGFGLAPMARHDFENATPSKSELDLIRQRLTEAERDYRGRNN